MHHINGKGEIDLCRAQPGNCPLKDSPHGTREEIEAQLEDQYGLVPTVNKRKLPPSEPMPEHWDEDEKEFWRAVDKKLGLLIHKGVPYVLGDLSKSVYYCLDCNTQFPKSEEYKVPGWKKRCENCLQLSTDGVVGYTLKPGAERFFEKEAVLESEWYHYTSHAEWESFLNPGNPQATVIHLGTEEAALDRWSHTRAMKDIRVYKVRLKQDAVVADNILQDDPYNNEISPLVADGGVQKGILMSGVTRYQNAYEDPGSFSLMVNPELIEIVDVTELNHEDRRI